MASVLGSGADTKSVCEYLRKCNLFGNIQGDRRLYDGDMLEQILEKLILDS